MRPAGEANLDGKILVDIANPLNYSQGMPPSLFVSNRNAVVGTWQDGWDSQGMPPSLFVSNTDSLDE